MTLTRLPSGSYRIRQNHNGKTYSLTVKFKPSKLEAMQLISEQISKDSISVNDPKRLSFYDACCRYISSRDAILSPSTVREYTHMASRLKKDYPFFSSMKVKDISQNDVQALINDYAKKPSPNRQNNTQRLRSPKSVRNFHGFISSVLKEYTGISLNTKLPQKRKSEAYIPTDDDVRRILDQAKGTDFEIALYLACLGLRRSEICAISSEDLNGNQLYIHKSKVISPDGKFHIKETNKTSASQRTIQLPDFLVEMLLKQGYAYNGYPNNISKFLDRLQRNLGIPHFGTHKLRHYFASSSHAAGIPDAYIMKSGGWKSRDVLTSVYEHALSDKQKEMNQIYLNHLDSLIPK